MGTGTPFTSVHSLAWTYDMVCPSERSINVILRFSVARNTVFIPWISVCYKVSVYKTHEIVFLLFTMKFRIQAAHPVSTMSLDS